ncbi:MAG: polyphosphate kinase 2 family protein [Aeromicrobium erythreum]
MPSTSSALRELLAVDRLDALDSRDTPGHEGGKSAAKDEMSALGAALADEQEKLYALGTQDDPRSLLLVLQGMDTSGKGGVIKHVAGLVDPLGLQIASFKKPTPEELEHDFLWRVAKRLPTPGHVGVFDRSHYEDVLIGRVRQLAPAAEIERRYDAINAFEREYVAAGGTVVKCLLHIDREDQADRLAARLDDPTKHWKFNPGDIDERALWDDYQEAYQVVLDRCSTPEAPWFVVPSGRKWYRNWAVATLLLEHLQALDLDWPPADFDVEEQRARLAAT